ncbi:MAG: hypothetical protein ACTHK0_16300 [Ginsengibacter sp.]
MQEQIRKKVAPLWHIYKNIEIHPFSLEDNAGNNPFIQEIENTGVVITPEKQFSFANL